MMFTTYIFMFGVSLVFGLIWIPKHELGFVYKSGKPESQIKIDIFVDLLCPDSKTAFLRMLQVADGYKEYQVQLKTHLVPLPYHTFAFMASKTVHAISQLTNDKETYNWMRIIFSNMSLFSGQKTLSKTGNDIMTNFIDLSKTLKVNTSAFTKLTLFDERVESDTRLNWKYACSRGVHSVPWFLVNDVQVDANTWTAENWKRHLYKLLT